MKVGVIFHPLTRSEDRRVRLLAKKFCRGMPEHRQRGARNPENSCPGRHAVAIRPSRSGHRQQPPSHPSSLYWWREGLRCQTCEHSTTSAACKWCWSRTCPRKAHCIASSASASDTLPCASSMASPTFPVIRYPENSSLLWGKPHGELSGLF